MTTPTGIYAGPIKTLRDMFAASSAFQTEVGAANATEALENVIYHRDDACDLDCFVLLGFGPWETELNGRGSQNRYATGGTIYVQFVRQVEAAESAGYDEAFNVFGNLFGAVIDEVLALSGTGGNLNIVGAQFGDPFDTSEAQEDGDAVSRRDILIEGEVRWSNARR